MTPSPSPSRPASPTGTARSWNRARLPSRWRERRHLGLQQRLDLADSQLYQDVLHPGKSLLWKIPLLTLMSLLPLACLLALDLALNR